MLTLAVAAWIIESGMSIEDRTPWKKSESLTFFRKAVPVSQADTEIRTAAYPSATPVVVGSMNSVEMWRVRKKPAIVETARCTARIIAMFFVTFRMNGRKSMRDAASAMRNRAAKP